MRPAAILAEAYSHRLAVQEYFAGGRLLQEIQAAEKRALSRAARTDNAEDDPGRYFKADTAKNFICAECFPQIPAFHDRPRL